MACDGQPAAQDPVDEPEVAAGDVDDADGAEHQERDQPDLDARVIGDHLPKPSRPHRRAAGSTAEPARRRDRLRQAAARGAVEQLCERVVLRPPLAPGPVPGTGCWSA